MTETARGFGTFPSGVRWLKGHLRYLALLFVPLLLSIAAVSYGWHLFFAYQDQVMTALLFDRPGGYGMLILYYLAKAMVYLGFLVLSVVFFILLSNIIGAPIYEVVSAAVERDVSGLKPPETSLWQSLLLIKEEVKKALFILTVSTLLLILPGINVISIFITAFLIGWDFYDIPLARRGWSFRERLGYVLGDFWAVTAFGLWLMIPFVQILFVPLAVAGGTMLSLESLSRRPPEPRLQRATAPGKP